MSKFISKSEPYEKKSLQTLFEESLEDITDRMIGSSDRSFYKRRSHTYKPAGGGGEGMSYTARIKAEEALRKQKEAERKRLQEEERYEGLAGEALLRRKAEDKYEDVFKQLPVLEAEGYDIEKRHNDDGSLTISLQSPHKTEKMEMRFMGDAHISCVIYGNGLQEHFAEKTPLNEKGGMTYQDRLVIHAGGGREFNSEIHLEQPDHVARIFGLQAAALSMSDMLGTGSEVVISSYGSHGLNVAEHVAQIEEAEKSNTARLRDMEFVRALKDFAAKVKEEATGIKEDVTEKIGELTASSPPSQLGQGITKLLRENRLESGTVSFTGSIGLKSASKYEKQGQLEGKDFLDHIDKIPEARAVMKELFNFCEENNMAIRFGEPRLQGTDKTGNAYSAMSITVSPAEDHYHPHDLHSRRAGGQEIIAAAFNEKLHNALNDSGAMMRRIQSKTYDFT